MTQTPRLPAVLDPVDGLPDDLEDITRTALTGLTLDHVDRSGISLIESRLDRVNWTGGGLTRGVLRDVFIRASSLAAVTLGDCGLRRVEFTECRLAGVAFAACTLRDVAFLECKAPMASFRGARMADVRFEGCDLSRASFDTADLTGASFVDCDLTGASFDRATMTGTVLSGCRLEGIQSVSALRGARIPRSDVLDLALTLAAAIGIVVDD